MSPRTLFNIILKIFGLFFLREIINTLTQLVNAFYAFFSNADMGALITSAIVSLVILAFYTVLVLQLLFKTNRFIDYLKLDQGFHEHELSFEQKNELQIGLSTNTILTIALIVIGGIMLTNEIPNFCRYFYLYVDQKSARYSPSAMDMSPMVFSGAKIIIGLLILGERKRIVDFIEDQQKVDTEEA